MKIRILRWWFNRYKLNLHQLSNLLSTVKGVVFFHLFKKYYPSQKPLILMIEPTNRCNFNCPLCDRGLGAITREEGIMSFSTFKNIINQAGKGLKLAMLWNQGEPLINKNFTEMVRYAKARNIFTVVSTNGSLLDRNAEKIVNSGLDELIISLDGATEKTFNLYRQGGDFNQIIEGVKKVVKLRGKRLSPLISLQFLLLKHNISEMEKFKDLAKEIGADRVLWKTVQVMDQNDAQEYLPENDKYSRYRKGKFGNLKRIYQGCRRILYSAVIDWNGNVVPCCFDKDEEYVVGNVLEDGLENVWRGEKYTKFRAQIASGDKPEMCSNCTEGLEKLFI